jgi:ribosomal protein S12 methylthiotransferase accessory factor
MNVAMIKAIAEAYERYASGNYKIDREGAASELGAAWLDPRLVRPLTDEQLENNPHMQPFDESSKIDWVEGKKAGERILVPIDMAYYPLNPHILDRALVAEADSSGVAAHTNEGTATRLALFELIERDAMMRNWLSQQSPDRLDGNLLPSHVQKRLEYWKERGYDMHVLDMSGDTAVIQTLLVNQKMEYPYFVNGAAASLEYDQAINKSLEEAELGLAHALSDATHERIEAADVRNPAHHGQFYYSPENAKYISWLWQGKVKDSLRNIDKDLDIIDRYTPIVVKLNSSEEPLSVVRVIAPSLVPINFGTGTEYFSHQSSGVTQKPDHVGKAPHYFA